MSSWEWRCSYCIENLYQVFEVGFCMCKKGENLVDDVVVLRRGLVAFDVGGREGYRGRAWIWRMVLVMVQGSASSWCN